MIKKVVFIIVLLFQINYLFSQVESGSKEIDDIIILLEKGNDNTMSAIERLSYVERAKTLSIEIKNDSLTKEAYRNIALLHWNLKNFNLYKRFSQRYLKLSLKLKDSASIAKAYNYLGNFYLVASQSDSAYFYFYNSEKAYRKLNNNAELGKQLLNIAVVQKNEKDFIGSEVTTIEAISLLEPIGEDKILSNLYNNLGIIYNELGQYNQAINYHEKALKIRETLGVDYLITTSTNNIAVVYKNAKQYNNALDYFNRLLNYKNLKDNDPSTYALVLDNYAHTKFLLNQSDELPNLFYKALNICDSIGDKYTSININSHISEYFLRVNQLDSAKHYAYVAKEIAEDFHNDDYLKALLNLSKIEEDSLSVKYYQEYIELNDSLQNNERAIRNKFARIRYETKEIEQKNEQITKERLYLLILSIGLLLTIFLTYSTISQRAKNKELKFTQQQQEANEEIYNLMLSQQDKIEEGRAQEKNRISEDLHDGILGRLFGTRLSLDSLNNNTNEDAIKNRSVYIDELKSIEQEIRKISHDLNSDFIAGSSYFDIIKTLIENQTQAFQLTYELNSNDHINWELVSNKTKINFYRIVQETLQNIYKHANAKHVEISFKLEDDFIQLEITDNGSGFDINKAKKGIGLKNIRSRAKELNGELTINSKREQGTTILVSVPAKIIKNAKL